MKNVMLINEINGLFFRKKNKIIIEKENVSVKDFVPKQTVATILKNLESLGYTLDKELIENLGTLSVQSAVKLHDSLIELLRKEVGIKASKKPLYYNFPLEVMEKSNCELYIDAILYALTGFEYNPSEEVKERLMLLDEINLKTINHGTISEFIEVFKNVLGSKKSISTLDKEIIKLVASNLDSDNKFFGVSLEELFDVEISFKEVLTFVSAEFIKVPNFSNIVSPYFKTATDVLRLATAMSEGDVSLAENTKFKSFSRKERRFLLKLLENTFNIEENMVAYKNKWIRLGERLHPNEYKNFSKSKEAFRKLRNGEKITTYNSLLEKAIIDKDLDTTMKLLKKKPSEFARRVNHLVSIFNADTVINNFEEIAINVTTPILLNLSLFFATRNELSETNIYIPKGNTSSYFVKENYLEELPEEVCERLSNICAIALVKNFSKREKLGNVYLDNQLENYAVPTSLRNTQNALRVISRGSTVPLNSKKDFIRLFLYWKQESKTSAVDLDLSVLLYDKDFVLKDKVSFHSLKSSGAVHSGDVRQAYNGATEFIDIDLKKMKELEVAYIIPSVYSYSQQSFQTLPECFIGIMERENLMTGEIFEPTTVSHRIDICSNSKAYIPFVFDINLDSLKWVDLNMNGEEISVCSKGCSNQLLLLKSILNKKKINLYELFSINASARGNLVDSIEEADVIFTSNKELVLEQLDVIKKELQEKNEIEWQKVSAYAKSLNIEVKREPFVFKQPTIISQFDTDDILSKYL